MKCKFIHKIAACVLVISMILIQSSTAYAARTTKYAYYSVAILGLHDGFSVCYVDFATEGDATYHHIYNYYVARKGTDLFNGIEGESMWVSEYPTYKRANYSATHKTGIPTPWGVIGFTYDQINLYNTF